MAMDLSKSYEYFQPEKVDARINIVGCGSVGATLAENLVRLGITNLALWDMDVVNPHNLANQIFRQQDIGRPKVEALADILFEINPEIKDDLKLYGKGWSGQQLSGYVFLCVDNIELRRQIVEKHFDNPYVKAMLDFRTLLESAQHYAADWSDYKMKKDLLNSMNFSHEEASEETPVSACGRCANRQGYLRTRRRQLCQLHSWQGTEKTDYLGCVQLYVGRFLISNEKRKEGGALWILPSNALRSAHRSSLVLTESTMMNRTPLFG